MTSATVRRATRADFTAASQLVTDSGLPTLGLESAWAIVVTDDVAGLTGVAALEKYESAAGPVFLLRSVAVRCEQRGSGLGTSLVRAALTAADAEAEAIATVGLLTETAAGYFHRFAFREVDRSELPTELARSPELQTLCPATARAFLRAA